MNASNLKKPSETDWTRIDEMTDEQIDTSDIPLLDDSFFAQAKLRMPKQKTSVTVSIDLDVYDWFKAKGEDINAALRIYVDIDNELSKSLDELNKSALTVASPLPELRKDVSRVPLKQVNVLDDVQKIFNLAGVSPKLALISLAVEIEKELREIIFSQGPAGEYYVYSLSNALETLEKRQLSDSHIIRAFRDFYKVRNQIVHERGGVSSDDVARAIDSGILIWKNLRDIPRGVHTVYHPNVEIYSDKEGKHIRQNVRGVIIESIGPDKSKKLHNIFPSTREHFQKGKQVAWEWNNKQSWGESWYRDPDTGEIKYAWTGAMEFVGRHIEDT